MIGRQATRSSAIGREWTDYKWRWPITMQTPAWAPLRMSRFDYDRLQHLWKSVNYMKCQWFERCLTFSYQLWSCSVTWTILSSNDDKRVKFVCLYQSFVVHNVCSCITHWILISHATLNEDVKVSSSECLYVITWTTSTVLDLVVLYIEHICSTYAIVEIANVRMLKYRKYHDAFFIKCSNY